MKYAIVCLLLVSLAYSGYSQKVSSRGKTPVKKSDQPLPVASGRQVYDMAPDNMPCIKPDMATVKSMPNSVKADDKIQFMPNALGNQPVVIVNKKIGNKARAPK